MNGNNDGTKRFACPLQRQCVGNVVGQCVLGPATSAAGNFNQRRTRRVRQTCRYPVINFHRALSHPICSLTGGFRRGTYSNVSSRNHWHADDNYCGGPVSRRPRETGAVRIYPQLYRSRTNVTNGSTGARRNIIRRCSWRTDKTRR